jgi:hypothetical protein
VWRVKKEVNLEREYLRGASLNRLSQLSGRSRQHVRRQLQLAGVEVREPRRFPSDPNWWRAQIDLGISERALAAELGCSTMTVYRHLRFTRPAPPTFEEWLIRNSQPEGGCRRWVGAHSVLGYAIHGDRNRLVHRLVWEQAHGPIPKGAVIAHACHQGDCVEPSHLYMTDPRERAADTTAAGRMHTGEDHWNHKLTWEAVRHIRRSHETTRNLADLYGVAPATITSVRAWRRWRNPPG